MYLVVFGNRSELDERIAPAERDAFFDGLVDSSSQLRANYAQSWKARRRQQKTRKQKGPPRCLSHFNRSEDEDEDGELAVPEEGEVQNNEGAGVEDAAAGASGGEEKNQSGSGEDEDDDDSTQQKGD